VVGEDEVAQMVISSPPTPFDSLVRERVGAVPL
jgi:hypothetical protein